MGMFDTVKFRYQMPNGKTEHDYQTKDLDCRCDFYEISSGGRLMRQHENCEWVDTGFDGVLTMTASDGYHLHFVQGKLSWIEVYSLGDKRWSFEPERYLADLG